MCVCVCVSAYVCVRERERQDRQTEKESVRACVFCVCRCVTTGREKGGRGGEKREEEVPVRGRGVMGGGGVGSAGRKEDRGKLRDITTVKSS